MPVKQIILAGVPTQRGIITSAAFTAGQDQRYINCLVNSVEEPITQQRFLFLEKRPGLELYDTPAAGSAGTQVFVSPSLSAVISAFGNPSTIYYNTTSCGAADAGIAGQLKECIFNSVTFIFFVTTAGTGWFIASDSVSDSTFSGDTHTNTVIDNITGLTDTLYPGQPISGTGIQAGTRVATVTSPTAITTTLATTGTATVVITKTHLAKIIDANFPSAVVGMEELDGYIFASSNSTVSGPSIHNSNLNVLYTWPSGQYIPTNASTDFNFRIAKSANHIVSFSAASIEFFYHAGNPSGSVLSRRPELTSFIGGGLAITTVNNYIFFTGPRITTPGIWMMLGTEIKKISSTIIDRAITASGVGVVSLSSFFFGGYTYVLACQGAAPFRTWLYCLELGFWNEQSFHADSVVASNGFSPTLGVGPMFVDGGTTGRVFKWDVSPTYQDNGSAFTMTAQTGINILNDGKGFTIKTIDLVADTQASGTTTLATSGDDYANFSTIGTFDMTSNRKRIQPGGYYENHVIFKLTNSDNVAQRWQSIIVDFERAAT